LAKIFLECHGLDDGTGPTSSSNQNENTMPHIAGPLLACTLALANSPANAQAGVTPATPDNRESAHPATAGELRETSAQPPTTEDVCRALEQSAAESALPVEFFARVIWQESRFNAMAVSPKGAEGIAQFMPATVAPSPERQRIAAYIPRWGIQLAAHLSEGTAWAIYVTD
jgi:soluble lytic murein transglycosylase-like protein